MAPAVHKAAAVVPVMVMAAELVAWYRLLTPMMTALKTAEGATVVTEWLPSPDTSGSVTADSFRVVAEVMQVGAGTGCGCASGDGGCTNRDAGDTRE
jgi:hypothetical protein